MWKEALLTNWKTTAGGTIAGLLMILNQVQFVLDEDVATSIDWNVVASGLAIIWAAIAARDWNVSSERSKAV